jgi:hypothetical protein
LAIAQAVICCLCKNFLDKWSGARYHSQLLEADIFLDIKSAYIGISFDQIPDHDPSWAWMLNYIAGVLYRPILAMVKNSVLVFLLKFATARRAIFISIWVLLTVNTASIIAFFFAYTFSCRPQDQKWSAESLGGHCDARTIYSLFSSGWTIFTDLLVLALPFWLFLGSKMAKRQKLAIIAVFCLGIL